MHLGTTLKGNGAFSQYQRLYIQWFFYLLGDLNVNLVDDSNVTQLFSGFNKIAQYVDADLVSFTQSIQEHELMIRQLSEAITDMHQKLDYFIHVQDLLLPFESRTMDVLVSEHNAILAAGAYRSIYGRSCTNSSLYKRSLENDMFEEYSKVQILLVLVFFRSLHKATCW